MDNETTLSLKVDIEKASVIVSRQWPGVIDADDVVQEIWIRLLGSNGSVNELKRMTAIQRKNSLVSIGHQIAAQYRADYELFTGQVYYGTQDVREILDRGALTEEKTQTDTERMDLEEGLDLLKERNENYARFVFSEFALGEAVRDRKAVQRSVDSLTNCMNQVHKRRASRYEQGPGTRKVISNGRAQAISKNSYEKWGVVSGT